MAGLDTPEAITAVQDPLRRDQLNTRVQYYAAMGWHVESGSDFRAVVAKGTDKLPNTVNLILTLATGGLWLIYWIFAKRKRRDRRMGVRRPRRAHDGALSRAPFRPGALGNPLNGVSKAANLVQQVERRTA